MPELLPTQILRSPLSSGLGSQVIDIVRGQGFCVIESAPVSLDAVGIARRTDELHRFGISLGTPLVQSPRREMVEDVKDYSDVESADDRGYRRR